MQGTKNYGLIVHKSDIDLHGFADPDWVSDKHDRKSYTGYIFKLFGSSIQKTVTLFSTETEYMAIAEAAKEIIYLKN